VIYITASLPAAILATLPVPTTPVRLKLVVVVNVPSRPVPTTPDDINPVAGKAEIGNADNGAKPNIRLSPF
jgi:hypothetical protein